MFVNILLVLTIGLSLSESANKATFDDGSLDESKKIPLDPTLAWMSSTFLKRAADNAVKNICSEKKILDTSSCTTYEKYPGWAIDLGKVYHVEIVAVRLTGLWYANIFNHAHAFVWKNKVALDDNMDFSKSCAYFNGQPYHAHQNVVFPCKRIGRFAGIVLKQKNHLWICQVTIYGTVMAQVDGSWSVWSNWTECSKSCGAGDKSQTRTCTNPSPKYGGKECKGDTKKIEKCYIKDCPDILDPSKENK